MAVASVLDFLVKRGAVKDVRAANGALDRLFDAVRNDEKYRPERYEAALAGIRNAVAR
jgi:hypothetical protein